MAKVQMGDVASWAHLSGLGRTGISIGGKVLVYAGEVNVKVNTIEATRTSLNPTNPPETVFRRK